MRCDKSARRGLSVVRQERTEGIKFGATRAYGGD